MQVYDPHIFVFVTQFDLIKLASYKTAILSNQTKEWSKAIISE